MAITKETLIGTISKVKVCMDEIYERKSSTGTECLVVASNTMPTKTVHWICPSDDTAVAFEASKIITSGTQPTEADVIWINTKGES